NPMTSMLTIPVSIPMSGTKSVGIGPGVCNGLALLPSAGEHPLREVQPLLGFHQVGPERLDFPMQRLQFRVDPGSGLLPSSDPVGQGPADFALGKHREPAN